MEFLSVLGVCIFLLTVILFLAITLGILYILYRIVMRILRKHLDNKYKLWEYLWIVPVVVVAYLWDIGVNYTGASLLCWEFPKSWREEKTVSERLSRYKLTDCGWRSKYTAWIGPKLLDKWDPKGVHIGYVKPTII